MTSDEAHAMTKGFLNQVKGIFQGLEKLPGLLEEIERREQAVAAKEASLATREAAHAEREAVPHALRENTPVLATHKV